MNQKIINDLLCMERRLEVRKMMAAQLYMRECTEQENNPHENSENSLRRGSQSHSYGSYGKNFIRSRNRRRRKRRKFKTDVKPVIGGENTFMAIRPNRILCVNVPTKKVELIGEDRSYDIPVERISAVKLIGSEKERDNLRGRRRKRKVTIKRGLGNTYVSVRENKILYVNDPTKRVELVTPLNDRSDNSKNTNVDAHSKQRVRTRKR